MAQLSNFIFVAREGVGEEAWTWDIMQSSVWNILRSQDKSSGGRSHTLPEVRSHARALKTAQTGPAALATQADGHRIFKITLFLFCITCSMSSKVQSATYYILLEAHVLGVLECFGSLACWACRACQACRACRACCFASCFQVGCVQDPAFG